MGVVFLSINSSMIKRRKSLKFHQLNIWVVMMKAQEKKPEILLLEFSDQAETIVWEVIDEISTTRY